MYSKKEAAELKQAFWTAFGQYMRPVLSAEEEAINWMNYKTGEKDIYFRMHADNKKAAIGIELTHKDAALQGLFFEQFQQLKQLLHEALEEEWTWRIHARDENGKIISRIYTEISGVSVYKREDWQQLISFFKPRLIALDQFWCNVKYVFGEMR